MKNKIEMKQNEKDIGHCPNCGKKWSILDVPQLGLNRTVEVLIGDDLCNVCEGFMGNNSGIQYEGILG